MRDFIMAAVPLVVTGIALAVFFAGRAEKKKKQEKENGYEAEGMSLGMCFGAAVGAMFPEYIGVTLSMGMLTGWSSECVSGRSTNEKMRGMEHLCGMDLLIFYLPLCPGSLWAW